MDNNFVLICRKELALGDIFVKLLDSNLYSHIFQSIKKISRNLKIDLETPS